MVLDDKPANQKVTLSTETIELLNEVGGEGQSYDTLIQKACQKLKDDKETGKDRKAAADQKQAEENSKTKNK